MANIDVNIEQLTGLSIANTKISNNIKSITKLSSVINSCTKNYNEFTTNNTDLSTTNNLFINMGNSVDQMNDKLDATGANSEKASSGLGKLVKSALSFDNLSKGMDMVDQYINTSNGLARVNDGLQSQMELQNKVNAAATRSNASYSDMANVVSDIGSLDTFGSNDETIAFTELMQKTLKVEGSDQSITDVARSMSDGVIQGDEFSSLIANAPMIGDALSSSTGKSSEQLQEMAGQGMITADLLKKSMFAASDDISIKFDTLPMTFADVWNKIKNVTIKAFGPVIKKISDLINTDKFKKFTDDLVTGLNIVENTAGKTLDGLVNIYEYISSNWNKLVPVIEGVTAAWLAYKGALLLVGIAQGAVNLAAFTNPAGVAILIIAVLVGAFVLLWEKCEGFRKLWVNLWKSSVRVTAIAYDAFAKNFNLFKTGWNILVDSMHFFISALRIGMISAMLIIKASISSMIDSFGLLVDMMNTNIKVYNTLANAIGMKTIDFNVNSESLKATLDAITSKSINVINSAYSGVDDVFDNAKIDITMKTIDEILNPPNYNSLPKDQLDLLLSKDKENPYDPLGILRPKPSDYLDYAGDKLEDFTISGWLSKLFDEASGAINSLLSEDGNDPIPVEGTGPNGSVPVDMEDEDLGYLRDMAERDYIANVASNTLAPNISVSFGDVHETADVDQMFGRIRTILREQIAIAPEGVY
jgi:tape measure domain-containing protein